MHRMGHQVVHINRHVHHSFIQTKPVRWHLVVDDNRVGV
jgi:hypothetical protein